MRISQFFSIDTAKSLVPLGEFDPDLMDRISRREPNAYLAALYWDSEMFRGSGRAEAARERNGDGTIRDAAADPKQKVYELLADPERKRYPEKVRINREVRRILFRWGHYLDDPSWRRIGDVLQAGDPKRRTVRAIIQKALGNMAKDGKND